MIGVMDGVIDCVIASLSLAYLNRRFESERGIECLAISGAVTADDDVLPDVVLVEESIESLVSSV